MFCVPAEIPGMGLVAARQGVTLAATAASRARSGRREARASAANVRRSCMTIDDLRESSASPRCATAAASSRSRRASPARRIWQRARVRRRCGPRATGRSESGGGDGVPLESAGMTPTDTNGRRISDSRWVSWSMSGVCAGGGRARTTTRWLRSGGRGPRRGQAASASSGASRNVYQKASICRMYASVWKMPGITIGSWMRNEAERW